MRNPLNPFKFSPDVHQCERFVKEKSKHRGVMHTWVSGAGLKVMVACAMRERTPSLSLSLSIAFSLTHISSRSLSHLLSLAHFFFCPLSLGEQTPATAIPYKIAKKYTFRTCQVQTFGRASTNPGTVPRGLATRRPTTGLTRR